MHRQFQDVQKTFFCSILNREPLVILTAQQTRTGPLGAARFMAEHLKDTVALFVVARWWSLATGGAIEALVREYREHTRRYPAHHFLFLCNDDLELQLALRAGVPAALGPTNALVDEKIFTIQADVRAEYDSVYVAQMFPYKNHYLCQALRRPAFIYTKMAGIEEEYFRYVQRINPTAVYLNHLESPTGEYKRFTPAEVATALNSAAIGLCLSWLEGGMYASMEYMLCGRPVVTIPSVGGRELFYSEDYWIRCDSNPPAVGRAITDLLARSIPPSQIREDILGKQRKYRAALFDAIDGFVQQKTSWRGLSWERIYFNKLLEKYDSESLLGVLSQA